MISLVSLFSFYIVAAILGRRIGGDAVRLRVSLPLVALVQVAIVMIAMYVMDPPSMVRGGH
jgi:hypothetical protein